MNAQLNERRPSAFTTHIVYTYRPDTNSLQGLLNCEIGGLDCRVVKTEYRTRDHCMHM